MYSGCISLVPRPSFSAALDARAGDLNYSGKGGSGHETKAAYPFFTTPWQSLIVPQPWDISLKATQRISECLLSLFGLSL